MRYLAVNVFNTGVAGSAGVGMAGPGGRNAGRGRGVAGGVQAPAMPGPGARGPPPPPRDNVAPVPRNHHRKPGETPTKPKRTHSYK